MMTVAQIQVSKGSYGDDGGKRGALGVGRAGVEGVYSGLEEWLGLRWRERR